MEVADVSHEGSEVVGGEGVVIVVVVLFCEEGADFLAFFCTIGGDDMVPLLDFQALFALVLVPTSSGALTSSGLPRFCPVEGLAMVIGAVDGAT